jgi:hypothetical protein
LTIGHSWAWTRRPCEGDNSRRILDLKFRKEDIVVFDFDVRTVLQTPKRNTEREFNWALPVGDGSGRKCG